AAHRDSALALSRPLAAGERIDADRATAQELSRLPRVGLALAKTIVADRDANGPFGGLAALDRVPGIGPRLLGALGAHLTFSGTPVARPSGSTSSPGATALLNLNMATPAELDALPGIGPARARAIVEFRERHGFFSAVDQLRRVPGLGPAAVTRLRERVTLR
ncbi:MAG: ComEA family DNA-binding protein, partial [Gemmatimonadales bacterium]